MSLVVLLVALVGKRPLPWGLPGAFAAVAIGAAIFWGREGLGLAGPGRPVVGIHTPVLALPFPTLAWLGALEVTLPYLAVGLPFALATIVGGIDNTESAVAAGDEYRTRDILLTEAGATLLGSAGRLHAGHGPRRGRRGHGRRGGRAPLAPGRRVGLTVLDTAPPGRL